MTSLFDSLGSQNFPGNPSVPPGPPPGYAPPGSHIANPASTPPPYTNSQIAALQSALHENNLAAIVEALVGAYVPSLGPAFDQLVTWGEGIYNDIVNSAQSIGAAITGLETAAWNDLTEMYQDVEDWAKQLSGGFQQLQTWWNALINGVLGAGNKSVFDLTSWLTGLNNDLSALQADSTASTAAFGTFLTSVESAITGYTNWSTFIAAVEAAWNTYSTTESGLTSSAIFTIQNLFDTLLGVSTGNLSDVAPNASNGSSWATRLTNDLLVLSDVFHITYAAGTPSDPPGTLSGGKPTWYSSWNDLLALCGVVNSTSAPIDAAPALGQTIVGNAATAAAATQAVTDAITSGVTNTATSGSSTADASAAVAGMAQTLAQVQSNVQTLQAGTAPVGGVQITDAGAGTTTAGSGWGANWTVNAGSLANLNRGFNCTGGNVIGSYTGESLNTTNQIVGIIFNSLPAYPWAGDSADGARHRIKVRESSDRSACVFADIWHDKVQLGYRLSNIDTYWGSPVSVTAGAGSNWELYAGDGAGATPYLFQLIQNSAIGSPVVTYTDSAHVSALDSSHIGVGQDMYSDGSYLPGNTKFHARDQIAPALLATVAEHHNTSTTPSAVNGGLISRFPVGWFNSQTYLMPGITMSTDHAGYTVSQEGLYIFSWACGLSSGISGTPYIAAPGIWVNSAPIAEGGAVFSANGSVGGFSIEMCRPVYLFPGDSIYPMIDTRANQWNVLGESTGIISWMQLAKVI